MVAPWNPKYCTDHAMVAKLFDIFLVLSVKSSDTRNTMNRPTCASSHSGLISSVALTGDERPRRAGSGAAADGNVSPNIGQHRQCFISLQGKLLLADRLC